MIVHRINGKTYSDYYMADRVSAREWAALGVVVFGGLVWLALLVGGVGWVIYQLVLHR